MEIFHHKLNPLEKLQKAKKKWEDLGIYAFTMVFLDGR
jgi:hypothetical protein